MPPASREVNNLHRLLEQGVQGYGLLEDSTVFVLCQTLRRDERHVYNLSFRNQFTDQIEPPVQSSLVVDELVLYPGGGASLPQTTSMISSRFGTQSLKKFSRAGMNLARGVSIHGSSSMKMTFFPAPVLLSTSRPSILKASI